jgi:hypothetical protein
MNWVGHVMQTPMTMNFSAEVLEMERSELFKKCDDSESACGA